MEYIKTIKGEIGGISSLKDSALKVYKAHFFTFSFEVASESKESIKSLLQVS